MNRRFEVVLLGTGSPLPNPDRCGAGTVIVGDDTHVMVDCGWGAARRLLTAGVRPGTIDIALFTHMHSDHVSDVPDFLFQRWTGGATTPLRVYGPEGTRETMEGFLMALRRDIGFRLAHHGDKLHPDGIRVDVTEVRAAQAPARFLDAGGIACESFEVDHRPVVPAFGYRFAFDGRTVVLSGDTGVCDSLREASRDADMLVCEALNMPMMQQRIAGLRAAGLTNQAALLEDVPSYHISTEEVARLAQDAGVGTLVLTHLIPSVTNDPAQVAAFCAGMADIYRGDIHVGRDAERLTVGGRVGDRDLRRRA